MKKRQIKKTTKKTSPKKEMSVSELAGMVARGFTEVNSNMNDRFERVEAHIGTLEHKVDRVQDSVNELSYESRKMKT
ncbi:hypothetical protein A2118_01995 [Candidatus Kaiserbacteria bacterium GWA2_50_9]|uniref:Uncharacterized protein n=1 Tax=Candidatus Kaiserbacteria bacterium GWA2_50_9 TaxID=1798474 RepID=A0A1F6BUW1_9BACT|nr:MAG: hypothetical protein A2118_01995 [Candidatus Kaiserbacteria bacterium GWA2_50_9]